MQSAKRLTLKSITWQASGLIVMMVIGYVFTGSLSAGGGIAITGSLIGFVSYFIHELAWSRIRWGQS